MKNRKTLRTLAVLLIMVLLTSCIVGTTFAKYITQANGTDKARVAKWFNGAVADVNIDLFESEYLDPADGEVTVDSNNAATDSNTINPAKGIGSNNVNDVNGKTTAFGVNETGDTNLVAPGTTFRCRNLILADFFDGVPEVAYSVDVDAVGTPNFNAASPSLDDRIKFYYRKVDDHGGADVTTAVGLGGIHEVFDSTWHECSNFAELVSIINDYSYTFTTNDENDAGFDIGWEWVFSDGNDANDTALGAELVTALDNLQLDVKFTATQID